MHMHIDFSSISCSCNIEQVPAYVTFKQDQWADVKVHLDVKQEIKESMGYLLPVK